MTKDEAKCIIVWATLGVITFCYTWGVFVLKAMM